MSDRWVRLRLPAPGGLCTEVARSTGKECRRQGDYAGRCYQHHPDADMLIIRRLDLQAKVAVLVRSALGLPGAPGLAIAATDVRAVLADVERLEAMR